MPDIEFTYADDTTIRVAAAAGQSVMKVAVNNDVPGIIGECGGEMSCATCHVFDLQSDEAVFEDASEDEIDVLTTVDTKQDNSRLGCQLRVPDVECLRFFVPD